MGEKTAYDIVRQTIIALNSKPYITTEINARGNIEDVVVFWFSGLRYERTQGIFTFILSDAIAPYLTGLKAEFTRFRLEHVYQFRSAITWKLYENLKRWEGDGSWSVALTELREFLGMAGKYPKWADFKKWVIDKALAEINLLSDIRVSYAYRKRQKLITGLEFNIASKAEQQEGVVGTIGDTANDMRLLRPMGLSKPQAEALSRLAKEAGKDLEFYLRDILARWEAKPEAEQKAGNKAAYIYSVLHREFSPKLFTDEALAVSEKSLPVAPPFLHTPEPPPDGPELAAIKRLVEARVKPGVYTAWVMPLRLRIQGNTAVFLGPNKIFCSYITKTAPEIWATIHEAALESGFVKTEMDVNPVL